MSTAILINYLIAGGLLGIIGQSIRVIVGIRKMSSRQNAFDLNRLLGSLMIGFTAGAVGMLTMVFQEETIETNFTFEFQDILLLITIGYSGTDFIEGFFRTNLQKALTTNTSPNQAVPSSQSENSNTSSTTFVDNQPNKDIKITFGKNARRDTVSLYAYKVIEDLLRNSQNYSARITSTARSPYDQARIMYGLLIPGPRAIEKQRSIYGKNGDKVIDVFEESQNNGQNKEDTIAAMEQKILDLGPSKVSKHIADYKKLVVIDIAPSSIAHKAAFVMQFEHDERISRSFKPPLDNAYHLEIPNLEEAQASETWI